MPAPRPPPPKPILKRAASSEETSEHIRKKISFSLFSHVREFSAPTQHLDNKVVVLDSSEGQAPSSLENDENLPMGTLNSIVDEDVSDGKVDIVGEHYVRTHLEAPTPVVHTDPYKIKEIQSLFEPGEPVKLSSLIRRQKKLHRKLENFYADYREDFKAVLRASIAEYENRISAADPAILAYLNGQIRTFSLGDAEQGFDALAFRIDTIYCKMGESLQRIAEEALDGYTDRIDEIETDMLVETSSEEEVSDTSDEELPT